MRTEECLCGGSITAPSLAQAGPYVEAHGRSMLHREYRRIMGDPYSELLSYLNPRRERPTAGLSGDVSRQVARASAAAAEGRS